MSNYKNDSCNINLFDIKTEPEGMLNYENDSCNIKIFDIQSELGECPSAATVKTDIADLFLTSSGMKCKTEITSDDENKGFITKLSPMKKPDIREELYDDSLMPYEYKTVKTDVFDLLSTSPNMKYKTEIISNDENKSFIARLLHERKSETKVNSTLVSRSRPDAMCKAEVTSADDEEHSVSQLSSEIISAVKDCRPVMKIVIPPSLLHNFNADENIHRRDDCETSRFNKTGAVVTERTKTKGSLRSENADEKDYFERKATSNCTNKLLYSCEQCGKKFTYKCNLARHLDIHLGKSYRCYCCNKMFSSRRNMLRHMKPYTFNKHYSYYCDHCGKGFREKRHIERHILFHIGYKPYACDYCQKRYFDRNALKRHVITHTDEPSYRCTYCKKAFFEKSQLTKHLRIHTGEDYVCSYCPKAFLEKRSLVRHLRIHTGEKPYSCYTCGRKFNDRSHIMRHMTKHKITN